MKRGTQCALVLLIMTTCVLFHRPAMAEEDMTVLPKGANRLLYRLLLTQSKEKYDTRAKAVEAALKSPEAARRRGKQLREDYRQLIGELPERKTPLNATVTGVVTCDGYNIEKVLFESRPNHRVTANVYVPTKGKGPFPAVIVPCGHAPHGKGGYQAVGALFALNGFVAMVYDPICQGERYQIPQLRCTQAHSRLLPGSLLVGRTVVGYEAWDGIRCIDYLMTRSDVDSKKPVGVTGNSGGGCQTNFLMGLDERIGPAAPSGYFMRKHRKFETLGPGDGCQNMPNEAGRRIDHADMAWMRAPKPTLILAAEKDFVEFKSTKEAAGELKELYTAIGEPAKTSLFSYNDKHSFSKPRREAAVAWMKRWLLNDTTPVVEPKLTHQSSKALQVTTTGQVMTSHANELSVMQLNRLRAKELATDRKRFWEAGDEKALIDIKRMIGSQKTDADVPTAEKAGTLNRDGYTVEKMVIKGKDQFPLPALLFIPNGKPVSRPATIYVDSRGKSNSQALGEIEKLIRAGTMVLSVDLRGYGETLDKTGKRRSLGRNYCVANLAIQLGAPLLGQRVDDIMAAADILGKRKDVGTCSIVGAQDAGPVVLHAAALDKRFESVTLLGSIQTWTDTDPIHLASVVSGALRKYDLADLVKCISPRTVTATDSIRTPTP